MLIAPTYFPARRIVSRCQVAQILSDSAASGTQLGQEAASRQLPFLFFRVAVEALIQPGGKRSSPYESINSVKKFQNVYCFGGGFSRLWAYADGASGRSRHGRLHPRQQQ